MKLEEQMFKMVSDWFSSKQIKQEFLKDKAITVHKFNYWIRRYQDQRRQPKDFDGFKEIEIPDAIKSETSRKIEITTPSGFVISIVEEC